MRLRNCRLVLGLCLTAPWWLPPSGGSLWLPLNAVTADSTPVVEVRRIPNGGIQPEAVAGADGAIHLVYFAGEPAGGDIFYVRSTDGGATFSSPVRVNSQERSAIATGTIRGAQVAVAPDGRVHVAWNGSDRAVPKGLPHPRTGRPGSPMLYARSNPARTAFEAQRNLMTHTYNLDGGGSIAAADNGTVYVVWHGNDVKGGEDESARRVWLARSADAGVTFGAETSVWSEPTGACGCCGMRAFASGSTVRILYRSAAAEINRDIYSLLSSDRGRTFTGARLHEWDVNACPMTSMSIAAEGPRVFGAWETDGQVYFSELGGAGKSPVVAPAPARTATGASGSPDAGDRRRKHPRLAIDRDGRLLFVWTEGMAWARGGSLAWQAFGSSGQPLGTPGARPGVPVWSVGAAVARPGAGFVIFY
jgi:hypothetical protein